MTALSLQRRLWPFPLLRSEGKPPSAHRRSLGLDVPERMPRQLKTLVVETGKPCLICGRSPAHAHHIRFAQAKGVGLKVSDGFTVPLCATPSFRESQDRKRNEVVGGV